MGAFSLTRAAKSALKAIAKYTERQWGRAQRRRYLKEFDDIFRMLADAPDSGANCDYVEAGLLKHPHRSHVIYFEKVSKENVAIIRVLHKSMDVQKPFTL